MQQPASAREPGRVLPKPKAVVERDSWEIPPVFPWLQNLGDIAEDEMDRVFNRGDGHQSLLRGTRRSVVIPNIVTNGIAAINSSAPLNVSSISDKTRGSFPKLLSTSDNLFRGEAEESCECFRDLSTANGTRQSVSYDFSEATPKPCCR